MGRAKQKQIEMEERGYSVSDNKWVCANLFSGHRLIVNYIHANGIDGVCNYSGLHTMVVLLEEIVGLIFQRFCSYFENPAEECSFESSGDDEEWIGSGFHKENGYILPNSRQTYDTREALSELGFELIDNELFEDIASAIHNDYWVLVDPYGNTKDEELQWTWQQFSKDVCALKQKDISDDEIAVHHAKQLTDIVCEINRNLPELIHILPVATTLYRCVYYDTLPKTITAFNIWAPPADKASSQRMSREGQSRFYASFDKDTPLLEATSKDGEMGLLGDFRLKHDVNVLNLTNLPYRSFLDVDDYFSWCFLRQFTDYIAQPVSDEERYQYAPTQIMRDVFEEHIPSIQGIMYRSCKNPDMTNIVMFWDNTTCAKHMIMNKYEIIKSNN